MSQEERYGNRDQAYSAWHRRNSTRRFVGIELAQTLAMIDIDCALYVEYDDRSKEPLALVETACDVGQPYKTATVTRRLAERAGIPGWCVLYRLSDTVNPADLSQRDITAFRVKRLTPFPQSQFAEMTPQQWCEFLCQLRNQQANELDQEFQAANPWGRS